VNVEKLLNDPSLVEGMEIPPDNFQEKTSTLFNILCANNLEEKIRESKPVLDANKAWQPWFAYYLVKTRVSKETNQHTVYLQFLDGMGQAKLLDLITGSTFACLKVLLNALNTSFPRESILNSAPHRSVLKNLGSWLGQITVARNKAIKVKDLDLKQLLLDSYEKGHLMTTLPLVCRVMSCVQESRVFKPPNPWTTAILSVLAELHDVANLRTTLVFEIEILCKKLELSLADLKRSDLLVSRQPPADSPDFAAPKPAGAIAPPGSAVSEPQQPAVQPPAAQPSAGAPLSQLTQQLKQLQANWMSGAAPNAAAAAAVAALARVGPPPPVIPGATMRPPPPPPPPPPPVGGGSTFADSLALPANLAQLVSIPPSVALFQIQPKLRPLVPLAVERAIREIVNAVAERSVTISCLTTREVVLKDLSMESDENALRKAAQLMVGTLAGSLALVTCREPFRAALVNHLKGMLNPGGAAIDANEQALVEQVVQVITAENLDLGCVLVERAVYDRAVREINETIAMAVQARRLHREQQAILASSSGGLYTPGAFVDPAYENLWTQSLRQRGSGQVSPLSANIYKEFRDSIVRMEACMSTPLPAAMGPHPAIVPAGAAPVLPGLALPGVMARPMPPPPPVGLPPPPPPAAPPVQAGLPSLAQVQQLLASVKTQADSHEDTPELRELKTLLSRNIEELVSKMASVESLVTLPEIVENQPFQLDAYYGLISLGFNAEWLEYLRRVQMLLARDPSLSISAVWIMTRALSDRFDSLVSQTIPLTLPPPVRNAPAYLPTGEPNPEALAERAQVRAINVGCSVTEEHLFVELACAVMALIPSVLGGEPESISRSVHTPVMAWVMELVFSQLTESANESVRSALLAIILGALRYSLIKEGEMDRILARLLTEHRTIGTTGFVVHLLQVFTCRMRMSPLQHWPITTEVIYKMLQRVTAAGPLIPPNEKTLALQLDSFSKEMKAVANVSAERIAAYRQLHCLATRPPEPLPWDIVANQAMIVPKLSQAPSGELVTVFGDKKALFDKLLMDVVTAKVSEFKDMPPQLVGAIWSSLRSSGCELELPAAPGPSQPKTPDWVEGLFQSVIEKSVESCTVQNSLKTAIAGGGSSEMDLSVVDAGIALMITICNRGDLPVMEQRPMDILRSKYIRKMWEVCTNVLVSMSDKTPNSLIQRLFTRILSLTLQDVLVLRTGSSAYTNAVLSHFAKCLSSVSPQHVPLFTYGWIDLLANRFFLPNVLGFKGQRGWLAYERLLMEAVSFISAAVEQAGPSIPESLQTLIGGAEKLLLVINQDFPEFLIKSSDNLIPFMKSIHCVRLRNIVLSAIPKSVMVVDPFATSIKLDGLCSLAGHGLVWNHRALLESTGLRQLVVQYVGSRDRSVMTSIRTKLVESKYDSALVHALLGYIGTRVGSVLKQMGSSVAPATLSLEMFMDILMGTESSEGRQVIVETMVSMLRFPNGRTNVFSVGLLFVFAETMNVGIKELIANAILGRLVAERPHPWGVLVTFSELVKNPRFGFWKQAFAKDEMEVVAKHLALLSFPATPEGPSGLLKQIVEQQRR
jgi:hypothetical protein